MRPFKAQWYESFAGLTLEDDGHALLHFPGNRDWHCYPGATTGEVSRPLCKILPAHHVSEHSNSHTDT